MDSILSSIKKLLGIDESYEAFDTDIIININAAFMTLHQLGVGPSTPLVISDKSATWYDFVEDSEDYEAVKLYVYLKVRYVFDPPSSSTVMDAMSKQIAELEWRLNVQTDEVAANSQ